MILFEQIERFLWRRGFFQPALRRLMRDVLASSCFLTIVGLCALPWTPHIVWAGAMSCLSALNLYAISLFILHILSSMSLPEDQRKRAPRVVKKKFHFHAFFRLFISGFLIYGSIVFLQAHPAALASGLTFTLAIIPVSFFSMKPHRS